MEFRDLKKQYQAYQKEIDAAIQGVLLGGQFIGGKPINKLEEKLADYVGVKHCITCANGTDALLLALMAMGISTGDAVFVPDFTFFSTAEVVPWVGAVPVFVDVEKDTYNLSAKSLEEAIGEVIKEGKLRPRAVIAVDLFGQPADYPEIRKVTEKYGLFLLEDGAQGFGGQIGDKMACSFGDIATTSFFPAKPLGCYGDGGAVFTNQDQWAELINSYKVHGKGENKYDNVRLGMNSRLDTLQAAVLLAKLEHFRKEEIATVNEAAKLYDQKLCEVVEVPAVRQGFLSSWAQYTVQIRNNREELKQSLVQKGIPSMIYYPKPLHLQQAFGEKQGYCELNNTEKICRGVLSLPMHPFLQKEDVIKIADIICQEEDKYYK